MKYQTKQQERNGWIIAIVAIIITFASMALAWGADGAGKDPCAKERRSWRSVQNARRVGDELPRRYWTSWAALYQCENDFKGL